MPGWLLCVAVTRDVTGVVAQAAGVSVASLATMTDQELTDRMGDALKPSERLSVLLAARKETSTQST